MRPPQSPRNELDDHQWLEGWRHWRGQVLRLFFNHPFTALVSYAGNDPIYLEMPTFDENPPHHNDNGDNL